MDATTTRASTVIKSMPTSEMRTQASMTIPLSSTRSRTSIKLDPPETLSTAIRGPPSLVSIGLLHAFCADSSLVPARRLGRRWRAGQLGPPNHILRRRRREIGVVLPPVETYGLSFVENSIKNIQQVGCSGNRRNSLHIYLRKIRKRSGTGRIPAIHVTAS